MTFVLSTMIFDNNGTTILCFAHRINSLICI